MDFWREKNQILEQNFWIFKKNWFSEEEKSGFQIILDFSVKYFGNI